MPGGLTRRLFLEIVGQAGGGAALYSATQALGLQEAAAPPPFSPVGRAPAGARVLVLGAGIAGLTAAYELQKLGYQCEVIEARTRTGGRACTVRRGTVSEEVAPTGGQRCEFDEGQYFNPGPMRIPNTHATTLSYCRELNVPLEMFTTVNEAAYVYQKNAADPATARMRLRELHADWRGLTSEMLAKVVAHDSLDRPLSAEDKTRILEWLRIEGDLDANLRYSGTPRRGYRIVPAAGEAAGVPSDPVTLTQLLHTVYSGSLTTEIQMQTPMFQPVGGMDRLPAALAARVQGIRLGAEVLAIEQPADRVRVRYRDASGVHETEGHYAICTLPLPVLRDMPVDVAPAMRDAFRDVRYMPTGKIGLQFRRRFWEEDDGIYSGISRTDLDITQIVYPSHGYQSQKGVLIGYYQNLPLAPELAMAMGERMPTERLAIALEQGSRIHPQYHKEFETGFSVAWQNVRYSKGGWAIWSDETRKGSLYRTLCRPDRRLYLAGDHVTYTTAWMQGAFQSGRAVSQAIHERATAAGIHVQSSP